MPVGRHAVPRPPDASVAADEERRADDAFASSRPVAPGSVGLVDGVVGIAQQREAEAVLLAELPLRRVVVARDPVDRDPRLSEALQLLVELTGLGSSARGVRFREEVHDEWVPAQLREGDPLPVLVLELEGGGGIARLERRHGVIVRAARSYG